jgi:hypothetical protein
MQALFLIMQIEITAAFFGSHALFSAKMIYVLL